MAATGAISSKTYRYFAICTIAVSLIVGFVAGGENQAAPAGAAVKTSAPSRTAPVSAGAPTPATDDEGWSAGAWGFGAESAGSSASPDTAVNSGQYEVATAVTGAYESAQAAAQAGHAPAQLASPEQIQAMIEASRERSGPPTVTHDNDDESGLMN